MNPALIGYRASGKTVVGMLLAEMLGFECVDADVVLVERAGCSIADIFANQGEEAFRDLESEVIDSITQRKDVVLSLGGGAILRERNRELIVSRCSPVTWLQATVETIAARIDADAVSKSQRPNLTGKGGVEEIREVLKFRTPLYESCASLLLDTENKAPAELAKAIHQKILSRDVD